MYLPSSFDLPVAECTSEVNDEWTARVASVSQCLLGHRLSARQSGLAQLAMGELLHN